MPHCLVFSTNKSTQRSLSLFDPTVSALSHRSLRGRQRPDAASAEIKFSPRISPPQPGACACTLPVLRYIERQAYVQHRLSESNLRPRIQSHAQSSCHIRDQHVCRLLAGSIGPGGRPCRCSRGSHRKPPRCLGPQYALLMRYCHGTEACFAQLTTLLLNIHPPQLPRPSTSTSTVASTPWSNSMRRGEYWASSHRKQAMPARRNKQRSIRHPDPVLQVRTLQAPDPGIQKAWGGCCSRPQAEEQRCCRQGRSCLRYSSVLVPAPVACSSSELLSLSPNTLCMLAE